MKKISLFIVILLTIHTMVEASNPFFKKYNTPHGTAPFDKIKAEHYEPAFERGMTEQVKEIDKIIHNSQTPTFENTVVALEHSGELLSRVASVFFNLNSAETNDEMMEISRRISPKLSEHSNNVSLNEQLFARIKAVYDQKESLNLDTESAMLLEKTYRSFVNSGANLSEADKETYRDLSAQLSQLTLEFGQNVLKETNRYEMLLTKESDLAGMPESIREAAALKAKSKGKEGWLFDLSAPSYGPFMKYIENRDLREELYMASAKRSCQGGEFDNQKNVVEIANTRLKIAQLLGYKSYADYTLRQRMAKNPESVYKLLDELLVNYKPVALQEVREVQGFAIGKEGKNIDIMPWDWSFYSEKLQEAKFQINDELTRPYFELENVKKGVFGLATDLYGITFKKNTKIPVYHKEVDAYEVFDQDGSFLAVLYTDFFPREGKRQGAWMTSFKDQWKEKGKDSRPHISLVMNFTRPTETKPALLTFDEVETFLHEFGHGLHGIFADGTYESLSGTSVYRDFVELPSQVMENFLLEKEFLDRFAVHYQTGETIPASLVQNLINAGNYNAGYLCVRQLSFGYIDMAWHSMTEEYKGTVEAFEKEAFAQTAVLPRIDNVCFCTTFSHIFSGGYAAGYYGYKWAEVLDADAYAAFKEDGIFSKKVARKFRENVLSKGGSEDPMTLYVRFRGAEPKVDALMKRDGLIR